MFNAEARWDRELPHAAESVRPIEVGAVFKQGKIFPRWFVREGRKYLVKELTYYWQDKKGSDILHCFSVTDGTNLFELQLNSKEMVWRLAARPPSR